MESFKDNTIMKEERLLPVGTRVFDVFFGWGVIEEYIHSVLDCPIVVQFDVYKKKYTLLGYRYAHYLSQSLSLTEYTLEKGGFTPISDYWTKPKVGDWGYFWDNEDTGFVYYSQLTIISEMEYPYELPNGAAYKYFSHEIPEHIKEQMQQ